MFPDPRLQSFQAFTFVLEAEGFLGFAALHRPCSGKLRLRHEFIRTINARPFNSRLRVRDPSEIDHPFLEDVKIHYLPIAFHTSSGFNDRYLSESHDFRSMSK